MTTPEIAGAEVRPAITFVDTDKQVEASHDAVAPESAPGIGAAALASATVEIADNTVVLDAEQTPQAPAEEGYVIVNGQRLRKPRPVNPNPIPPVSFAPDSWIYRP
jgi:hypothetical protein